MKTTRGESLLSVTRWLSLFTLILFTCVSAKAAHELMYAVDQNNNLFSFYSDAPGAILTQYAISGVQNAEEIRGIDYYNGTIYGLGSFSRLYTLDPNSGAATQIGPVFSTLLNGATFGTDNGSSGFRVVSGLGQSLLLDRGTAAVTVEPSLAYVSGDPYFGVAARVDGLAYDNATGNWFAADTLQNTLASFNPATGGLSTIGMMGIDAARFNGFDLSPFSGILYMNTPAASSDPQANLYMIDKTSGFATLVGQIGSPGDNILVRGLTVIPEPGTITLLALGALGLFVARRRQ